MIVRYYLAFLHIPHYLAYSNLRTAEEWFRLFRVLTMRAMAGSQILLSWSCHDVLSFEIESLQILNTIIIINYIVLHSSKRTIDYLTLVFIVGLLQLHSSNNNMITNVARHGNCMAYQNSIIKYNNNRLSRFH